MAWFRRWAKFLMRASRIGIAKTQIGAAPTPAASLTVNITTDQTNYNLWAAAGAPVTAQTVTVNISSGVVIKSDNYSTPAFNESGAWAPGTTITINNSGSIRGFGEAGGGGGDGQSFLSGDVAGLDGSPGGTGGVAILLRVPTTINNAAGEIFGGGGGGGGGAGCGIYANDGYSANGAASGGGGGGGGRSAVSNPASPGGEGYSEWVTGVDGSDGSAGGPSGAGSGGAGGVSSFVWYYPRNLIGGAGGAGGDWGQPGANGATASVSDATGLATAFGTPGVGGPAGKAIELFGQALTWISGNTSDRVKGAVA